MDVRSYRTVRHGHLLFRIGCTPTALRVFGDLFVEEVERLTDGPGKLAESLDISRRHDSENVTRGDLRIEDGEDVPDEEEETSARIGLGVDCDRQLRFYVKGSEFIS